MMNFILRLFAIASVICFGLAAPAQAPNTFDRVYTANQISNTVSVIDPSTNRLTGEIRLGKEFPNVLTALYRGQALVHGLRYLPQKKLLAVVSIGSNSVTFISTETNQVIKTLYVGRSPHEPTFTPNGKQLWLSVRGEAYISVIDVKKMKEVKTVPVADGPGMVAFTPDGKYAYVCSSFTPELDIVNTSTYKIIKRLRVTSPFSPNICTSPDGKWVAFTQKDVGQVTLVNTRTQVIEKVIATGPITNHVTFCMFNNKLLMLVTVGGENKVKIFDVANNFLATGTVDVGAMPHGIWPSRDSRRVYVGLEYDDKVQAIDLQTMTVIATVHIGHSPQALVYASNAVTDKQRPKNLFPLADTAFTQAINLTNPVHQIKAWGQLSVRSIGLADLVEQAFHLLEPNHAYILALSRAQFAPFTADYCINSFISDSSGNYNGQSTGLIKSLNTNIANQTYTRVVLIDKLTGDVCLIGKAENLGIQKQGF